MRMGERPRKGTYELQWFACPNEDVFFFKKNPMWIMSRKGFNKSFFLWSDPNANDPASIVMAIPENQVAGRIFDRNEVAGLVVRDNALWVNVPDSALNHASYGRAD